MANAECCACFTTDNTQKSLMTERERERGKSHENGQWKYSFNLISFASIARRKGEEIKKIYFFGAFFRFAPLSTGFYNKAVMLIAVY
jgi:hypothetical protein